MRYNVVGSDPSRSMV